VSDEYIQAPGEAARLVKPDARVGVLVVEHKTTSADIGEGSNYWERLILDAQVSNYMEGVRSKGYEPRGVLYDVIRKVKMEQQLATPVESRKYTKATAKEPSRLYANQRDRDETLDEYRQRVRDDIGAHPDAYYRRGVIRRLKGEEKNAARNVWMVARSIRESTRLNQFPQNTNACYSYQSFCEYWGVCSGKASITDDSLFRTSGEHEELPALESTKRALPLVTTSSAGCFLECPKKYEYRYVMRRRGHTSSLALRVGTVVHHGLEVWWTTTDRDQALPLAIEAMRAMGTQDESMALDAFEMVRCEELLRGYDARWHDAPFVVLGAEIEFTAPLINPETGHASKTWQRGGKLDALILEPQENPV